MNNDNRHGSAAGWDGLDKETRAEQVKYKNQLKEYRRTHARELSRVSALAIETPGNIFTVDEQPRQRRKLFGDLFCEGEIAILFADTGVGKSTLAVQIADALARGGYAFDNSVPDTTVCPNETDSRMVVYIDFELSKQQFVERYSDETIRESGLGKHRFHSENFLRAHIDFEDDLPEGFKTFNDLIATSIGLIKDSHPDAKVLIIDNITYLTNSTTSMSNAVRLMKNLKAFKDAVGISILVIAHTPKRKPHTQLTVNDLQGSKMLANFADSIFAIGTNASDRALRYIKHIKSRSGAMTHHSGNVIICRIVKKNGFLHFALDGLGHESDHAICHELNPSPPVTAAAKQLDTLMREIKRLHRKGTPTRTIARQYNLTVADIRFYLGEE